MATAGMRTSFWPRSATPPRGSITASEARLPVCGARGTAMALMVKSRWPRSSSMVVEWFLKPEKSRVKPCQTTLATSSPASSKTKVPFSRVLISRAQATAPVGTVKSRSLAATPSSQSRTGPPATYRGCPLRCATWPKVRRSSSGYVCSQSWVNSVAMEILTDA